ncbi:MAG: TonB-dependent receptor [Saprospiraceae bacterium]|nr:TonB-dependent receptor [Saprospiraceae bacterium]
MIRKFIFIIILLFVWGNSFSQIDTINIEEVEISSSRLSQLYSESARIITVITPKDIKNAPVQSISELLEYACNVDVRQRNIHGVQADISIRGGSFEQTLILLNGIKINDPQTGHHNLNIPVELDDIIRIEILEGPGARVYGPNAFSGAINIITGSEKDKNLKLKFIGGEHDFYNASLSASYKIGKSNNFLTLSKKASSGYIENTDFDIHNIFYQNKTELKVGEIDFQAAYNNKAFGANSFYTPKYPNQFEQTKTTFANISLKTKGKFKLNPKLYWRRNQDRFELFRDNPAIWYLGHNYHLTDVLGTEISGKIKWKAGETAIGTEYRSENILSNVLGNSMNDTLNVPGEIDGKFTKTKKRENYSVFVEHIVRWKKLSISGGLLSFYTNDFDWNFYPGFDLSYNVSNKLKFFGSVNKTLRLPSFTELYYSGPTNNGNPLLKPEEAISYEIGSKYFSRYFTSQISVFRREGKNIIDWVKLPIDVKWESKNLTEVNSSGFEFSMKFNLKKESFFHNLTLSYSYLDVEKQSRNYLSYYVLDYLKHKATVSFNHKIYKDFKASWRINYQDRSGTYTEFSSGIEKVYKAVLLADSKLFWEKNSFSIFIDVTNIFNTKYNDISNITMPGRWIMVGVIFDFSLTKKKLFTFEKNK